MKRTGLRRGSGLKRRKPRKDKTLRPVVAATVFSRQHGLCACGCKRRIAPYPIGYHHAYPKARWPKLLNVADNVIGVAESCHARHESGHTRLPRSAVQVAEKLATTAAMRAYLDRTYA